MFTSDAIATLLIIPVIRGIAPCTTGSSWTRLLGQFGHSCWGTQFVSFPDLLAFSVSEFVIFLMEEWIKGTTQSWFFLLFWNVFLPSHPALEWSTHNFFIRYGNVFRTTFFHCYFPILLTHLCLSNAAGDIASWECCFLPWKHHNTLIYFSLSLSLHVLATTGCWSDVFVKLSRVMCGFFPSPEWLQLS